MTTRIGFLGLGAMGLPMARNVIKGGYELHITVNRNRKPVDELKEWGAIEHDTAAEVAANCDVLIAILPADQEMESVLLAEDVLENMKPDKLLIEMTSGSPAVMDKVFQSYSEHGIAVLDAPVSGGTAGAEQGKLTVMAGGDDDVLERARPVLDTMAAKIFNVGKPGAGKAVKAINQMMAAVHMVAAAEAAALSEQLGIDRESLRQVIESSSGGSWMFSQKLDAVLDRRFAPGFKLALMKKDVAIAVAEAGDLQLQLAQKALELYESAAEEHGERDFAAVSTTIKTDR